VKAVSRQSDTQDCENSLWRCWDESRTR
jgi:hypothetical protein